MSLEKIRKRIFARERNRCKKCGVPNEVLVERGVLDLSKWLAERLEGEGFFDYAGNEYGANERPNGYANMSGEPYLVRLALAHLDGNTENNNPENLAVLCQNCHLKNDRNQHTTTRRLRFEEERGLLRLF